MPWPYRYGVTVTVHRAEVDPRTQDRGTPTTHPLEHCSIDRGTSRRDDDTDGAAVLSDLRVFAAYAADVADGDQVALPGYPGLFHVDGDVLRHRSALTGTEACSEIRLARRKGPR